MCGIAGVVGGRDPREAEAMAATLHHRGPDGAGLWVDAEAGVGLAFRRLAIIDLTPTGDQPMVSVDGRFVLVFNGELYNFRELRSELSGRDIPFRGSSDTEVLLEAIAAWGISETLERANGMFALAAWDRRERVLHLARDRFGEKPLYYGRSGDAFVFASELKAIRVSPSFVPDIDSTAVASFLRHGYVPSPRSIYKGIWKLPPACRVEVRDGVAASPVRYWTLRPNQDSPPASPEEAEQHLDDLLRASVRLRMISDVPLGGLLSGGIDSSTVVAMMQSQSESQVRTFSIGFGEGSYDESVAAAAIARHLGTDHTTLTVEPGEALALVPRMAEIFDEPFADSSQIPTVLVSQLAREHVTVALSGDGADELFGGYSRYEAGRAGVGRLAALPPSVRRATAGVIDGIPARAYDVLGRRFSRPHEKAAKLARALRRSGDPTSQLTWLWSDPPVRTSDLGTEDVEIPIGLSPAERMMFRDTLTYLPDDILVKVDRASMSASLEGRMPFLDPQVAEFAWSLPLDLRIRRGAGKWLLRRVVHRYVPTELLSRPKMGFGVPVGSWLRGPLREWAGDLLSPSALARAELLDPEPVGAAWLEHLSGRDRAHELWAVLMLQAWLQNSPVAA